MFALGGVVLLASSIAGLSLFPTGCSQSPSAKSGSTYGSKPTKGTKGTKQVDPDKEPNGSNADNSNGEEPDGVEGSTSPRNTLPKRFRDRDKGPKEAIPVPAESTRELHKPVVAMSEAHAKTCLVKVGEPFPEIKLTELGGSEEELSQLRGEKLTVVVFWNTRKVYAAEQFSRLQQEVSAAYSKFGVKVVAINLGDAPEKVKQLATEHGIDFACLVDPTGEAFKLVATDKLPRTYLLDAEGKILWFDIEYSQGTRYELNNAVYFFLKKNET